MKIRKSLLATLVITPLLLTPSLSLAAIALANNVGHAQNFNTLSSTTTPSSTLPTDWVIAEAGANANSTYTVGTGSGTGGDTYSFGTGSNSDRALGGLQSASLNPSFGASFQNNTGFGTIDLTVSYVGEQWRLGTLNRIDQLLFSYSTNATSLTTGTWTSVADLHFTAPTTTGTVGALDGNLASNRVAISSQIASISVAEAGTFWIRWTDLNGSGSDDGLAIDDVTINAVPEPAAAVLGSLGLLVLLRRRRYF